MTSMKSVADRAGVSIATVSYVINGTRPVSVEKRRRVLQAIKETGYIPNASAQGLRSKRTQTIGLALSDITNPFYPDLARGCQQAAEDLGNTVVIYNTDGQATGLREIANHLRSGRIDGLIVASATSEDRQTIERLLDEGHHVVLAHRSLSNMKISSVVAANREGSLLAMGHLLDAGNRSILYLDGFPDSEVSDERRDGYLQALAIAGLEPWIIDTQGEVDRSYESLIRVLNATNECQPDAVFASSDLLALSAIDAIKDSNLQIASDIAVVGYDDIFISSSSSISLTTVAVDRRAIGRIATELLVEQILSASRTIKAPIVLPIELIIRQSTSYTRKAAKTSG